MISLKDVCRCFASMDAGKIQLMGIAPVPTVQTVQPLRSVQNVKDKYKSEGNFYVSGILEATHFDSKAKSG